MDLEPRHLRALLAIRDQGTITDAAIVLRIGQPAVSRTLAQAERILGVELVRRTTRHLTMTEAGDRVCRAAQEALRAWDAVKWAASGTGRPLRVGYSWAAFGEATTAVLHAWRRSHPDTVLELKRFDGRDAGLLRGAVDVAIIRGNFVDPTVEIAWVGQEDRMAALPADHPLADREAISVLDLADETLAVTPSTATTSLALWPPEHRPVSSIDCGNVDEWLTVIAAGDGVGLTPRATSWVNRHPGVAYVELLDGGQIPVQLAWPRDAAHPSVPELLRVVQQVLRDSAEQQPHADGHHDHPDQHVQHPPRAGAGEDRPEEAGTDPEPGEPRETGQDGAGGEPPG